MYFFPSMFHRVGVLSLWVGRRSLVVRTGCLAVVVGGVTAALATTSCAAPIIGAEDIVVLELVASDPVALRDVDMLAFDTSGNLFANRETNNSSGGVSSVDIETGSAAVLVTGIRRADGITLHPSGALYITSEVSGAATTNRVYRVDVSYDQEHIPTSATATSITTTIGINNPEGIVALMEDGGFGFAGDLYVCEDRTPGRVFRLELAEGDTATAHVFVGASADLRRPEGLALGDFGGLLPSPALFLAETTDDNVLRIDPDGTTRVLGDPAAVSLDQPDNVVFGHDGNLYVSEDVGSQNGRIIRIAADGTHEVVLSGFNSPQGMAFDVDRRDLYIAEQGSDRIWRARFETATGDSDTDGDVDIYDFAAFLQCFGATALESECLVFDYDRDDNIDLSDWGELSETLTGP